MLQKGYNGNVIGSKNNYKQFQGQEFSEDDVTEKSNYEISKINNKVMQEERKLKELMIEQATAFIEDAGEFFPYGTVVKSNGEIVPIGVYDNVEHLSSDKVIDVLEKEIFTQIIKNKVVFAGIGIDVIINVENEEGVSEKRNALMIKTSVDGKEWKDEFYPYRIDRTTSQQLGTAAKTLTWGTGAGITPQINKPDNN